MSDSDKKAVVIDHLGDIIAMARAIKKDVRRQELFETESDLKCLLRRVQTAIDSI